MPTKLPKRPRQAKHPVGWYIGIALAILLAAWMFTEITGHIWQAAPQP